MHLSEHKFILSNVWVTVVLKALSWYHRECWWQRRNSTVRYRKETWKTMADMYDECYVHTFRLDNHMRQKLLNTRAEKKKWLQEFGATNFRVLLNKMFWHNSQNKWIYLPEEWEFEGLRNGKLSETREETWQYVMNRNTESRPSRRKH